MRYKYFFILLITLLTHCSATKHDPEIKLPFSEIRIAILAKYKLHKVSISLHNARIFYNNKTISCTNTRLNIVQRGQLLAISSTGIQASARSLSLYSHDIITINYHYNGTLFQRSYTGSLDIRINDNCLLVVNTIPVEYYVQAAARAELGELLKNNAPCSPGWQQELSRAMEIAIRSYVFHFKKRHSSKFYDFCDLTHCIHFPGLYPHFNPHAKSSSNGMVMLDENKKLLCAYFHSTSGGTLTGPEVFWPKHRVYKYFRRGKDRLHIFGNSLSIYSPHYRWQFFISRADMCSILQESYITEIQLVYKQHRVTFIQYKNKEFQLKKIAIALFLSRTGRLLGWNKIKSNDFSITTTTMGWYINGHGLGHGVGLCQYGAKNMACQGFSHRVILDFYYNKPTFAKGSY